MIFKQWRFEGDCTSDDGKHTIDRLGEPLICARCGAVATEIVDAVQAYNTRREHEAEAR